MPAPGASLESVSRAGEEIGVEVRSPKGSRRLDDALVQQALTIVLGQFRLCSKEKRTAALRVLTLILLKIERK